MACPDDTPLARAALTLDSVIAALLRPGFVGERERYELAARLTEARRALEEATGA